MNRGQAGMEQTDRGQSRDGKAEPRRAALPAGRAEAGAAPAERRCRRLLESGHQCRRWALRGWDLCTQHGRYRGAPVDRPIEVPLLEDDASIELVLSQTVRQLAWGTIPQENGRAIIAACRVSTALLAHRLAEAKFRAQQQRMGVAQPADPQVTDAFEHQGALYTRETVLHAQPEDSERMHSEPAHAPEEPAAAAAPEERADRQPDAELTLVAAGGEAADHDASLDDRGLSNQGLSNRGLIAGREPDVPADVEPDVEPDAQFEPEVRMEHPPRFRGLKEAWDEAERRYSHALEDGYVHREGETAADRRASLARPWDGQYPAWGEETAR